jgi:hypothetical protein
MPTDRIEALQPVFAERWSDQSVRDVFEQLQPDRALRIAACRPLADTIRHGNRLASDRWGVTDGWDFVRLNFGRSEVVCLDGYGVRLMVHEPTVKRDGLGPMLKELEATQKGGFRSVPESVYITVPWTFGPERIVGVVDRFRHAHETHLEQAVGSGLNGMTRQGHHPGIVDAIAAVVGVSLPQPSYVRIDRPVLVEGAAPREHGGQHSTSVEGGRVEVTLSRVERSRRLRKACLDHYGTRCQACDVDLGEFYGPMASGLVHVHHLHPASQGERETDPIRDLRPVCPNCHLVIHADTVLRSIEDVRHMLECVRRRTHA